ncbi:hypothetical protein AA103193_0941 [Tanticharoenia sakaeratensis NBRC 103193]|nr:hypothetical protein AA103193_0941 [Tanticharoenia sakaeratensis NBRC 103193]
MYDARFSGPGRTKVQSRKLFYPRGRDQMIGQFLRFGVVGAAGFLWDWGTVQTLRPLVGLTAATLLAYFVAATANWVLNRLWTFRNVTQRGHLVLQWLRFLLANSLGFLLNRGTVYTLYLTVPLCSARPELALAAGALAGMFANFNLSRKLVFRAKAPETPLELARMAVELPGDPITAATTDHPDEGRPSSGSDR